ncbi:TPA: adhesin, partial [Neisseria meningitidis]
FLSDTSIRPYGNHTGNSAPSVEADNSHEGYGYSDEAVRQHRQGQP